MKRARDVLPVDTLQKSGNTRPEAELGCWDVSLLSSAGRPVKPGRPLAYMLQLGASLQARAKCFLCGRRQHPACSHEQRREDARHMHIFRTEPVSAPALHTWLATPTTVIPVRPDTVAVLAVPFAFRIFLAPVNCFSDERALDDVELLT